MNCDELAELGWAWFRNPGCEMYTLIWEHRQSCPVCRRLATKIIVLRKEKEQQNG